MIDRNGDTVDTFPPFSTLKDEPEKSTGVYEINDKGEDSPRVIGEVAGGTETTSEGGFSAEGNDILPTACQAFLMAIPSVLVPIRLRSSQEWQFSQE